MDGDSSLIVDGNGWGSITSRQFDTMELPVPTSRLSLDVFVPAEQPGDPYWVGDVQVFLTCESANMFDAYVGQDSLNYPFEDAFNALEISIPAEIRDVLAADHQGCHFTLALNVGQNAGMFRLDRMGFLSEAFL